MRRRILPLLALMLLFLSASAFAQLSVPNEMYKLDNGLNIILHEDHSTPIVTVNLWYHVGSKNEKPGRTGFAHLFEHMMFQGSANVGNDQHFKLLQEAGGSLNGSTSEDRTNYYETVPSNFLELALWLESDRMGFLPPAMTQESLDNQRDVVKNERRQRMDNRPYGQASERISKVIYPPEHPYHWSVIGSMEDLSAASLEDVKEFFAMYYAPNNVSLAIAGDFDPAQAKEWVDKYFSAIPAGPPIERPAPEVPVMPEGLRGMMEDRVQLPQLYMTWHIPAAYEPDEAALDVLSQILSSGKNSRLYKSLVYEAQTAASAYAYTGTREIAGLFRVVVRAKEGIGLTELETAVWNEIENIQNNPPTEREIQRAINGIEAGFIFGLQRVGGKANRLNAFYTWKGIPDYFAESLARYSALTPEDISRVALEYLDKSKVYIYSVVPEGKPELQAAGDTPAVETEADAETEEPKE